MNQNHFQKERIQKLISQAGIASRREAEILIKKGKVEINDQIVKLGDKANFNDQIFVNGKPIYKQEKIYYLLNKPTKTVSTLKDNFKRQTVRNLINTNKFIFPIGRLDYNTTGAMILTNDGDLAHKLAHPSYEITRVYRASINSLLSMEELDFLNSDQVIINNKKTLQQVHYLGAHSYLITLHQGSYHHIKFLFDKVNKNVKRLKRVEFAGISVQKLMLGSYRLLTSKEIKHLQNLVKQKNKQKKEKYEI